MGKMAKPKIKRNLEIYFIYTEGGRSLYSIAKMYDLTPQRVHQIVKSVEKKLIKKGENDTV